MNGEPHSANREPRTWLWVRARGSTEKNVRPWQRQELYRKADVRSTLRCRPSGGQTSPDKEPVASVVDFP